MPLFFLQACLVTNKQGTHVEKVNIFHLDFILACVFRRQ